MFPNRFSGNVVLGAVIPFLLATLPAFQQVPVKISNRDTKLAVKVTVDGETIDFKGVPPQMQGSRIMVPMRGVFEHMGAQLAWDPSARTVRAVRGESRVVVTVGKTDAMVNGQVAAVETPPIVAEGRVMVPLRFLAHALGAKVEWLGADRTVAIETGS
jgi:hypothetical protein